MKRKTFFIPVLAMIGTILLTGCGKDPKNVVGKFCDAFKKLDYAKMNECMLTPDSDISDPFKGEDEELEMFNTFVKEQAGKMEYEIIGSTVDGDAGTVSVKFIYTDAGPVVSATFAEYFTQALAMAFSGGSDEQMEQLLTTIFQDKLQNTTLSTTTETVVIDCVKSGKDWKIKEVGDGVANVMTCNILKSFEAIGNSLGGSNENTSSKKDSSGIEVVDATKDNTDENMDSASDAEEEINYTDVPMGQEVQLATMKLTVTGCEEAKEIKNSYSTSTAKDGTKYVIFTLRAENTTKSPFDCAVSDVPLMDDQGRYFSMDTDATIDADNDILYRELNPNMPEEGVVVYSVPEDATGYGMTLAHADTEEAFRFLGK